MYVPSYSKFSISVATLAVLSGVVSRARSKWMSFTSGTAEDSRSTVKMCSCWEEREGGREGGRGVSEGGSE